MISLWQRNSDSMHSDCMLDHKYTVPENFVKPSDENALINTYSIV